MVFERQQVGDNMNKLNPLQRAHDILNFCKVSNTNAECLVADVKWFAKAYHDASEEKEKESRAAKVSPLSEVRIKYLAQIATYLRRWVKMFSGYSEATERTSQFQSKMKDITEGLVKQDL